MYSMKALKVAEARARFGELLDEAEKGSPVSIERRGVRFRIIVEPVVRSKAKAALFEFVHPDVSTGRWTWKAGPRGLRFAARKRR
jgi:antitoxin (DNA-binding transcriptional repressor) of toxin-antitoxin stability system